MPSSIASPKAHSDEALVRSAQRGNAQAWYRLVEMHQGMVFALIRRWGHQEDADDVFQEIFLRIYKYLNHFRFESSLKTWIHRIAMNSLKDWAKQKQERATHELQETLNESQPSAACPPLDQFPSELEDPHRVMDDRTRLKSVREQFALLSPAEREILILRDLEDRTYEEIAQLLALELGTVKSRICRARKALVRVLTQKGLV